MARHTQCFLISESPGERKRAHYREIRINGKDSVEPNRKEQVRACSLAWPRDSVANAEHFVII